MLSSDPHLRQRAADTARRVTERQPELFAPHAEALLGLFSESAGDNWRTRAHLGLVVARVAQSHAQRIRAAGLLMPLYYDPSNVVRATAIEGLGILVRQEPSLRRQFEALAEEALATGTPAMQDRAKHALASAHAFKAATTTLVLALNPFAIGSSTLNARDAAQMETGEETSFPAGSHFYWIEIFAQNR